MEKEREELAKALADKPMSRTSSRTARERGIHAHEAPAASPITSPVELAPTPGHSPGKPAQAASVVRPSFSFANAAGGGGKSSGRTTSTGSVIPESSQEDQTEAPADDAQELPKKVAEISI